LAFNLHRQAKHVIVGKDESIEMELDTVRSEWGVFKAITQSGVAQTICSALPSNRLFHVRTFIIANYSVAGSSRLDLYDDSAAAVNTIASFALNTNGKIGDSVYIAGIQGMVFSTGYISAIVPQSNVMVFIGGVIRPKTPAELQTTNIPAA
jgi:hypothetical protein